MREPSLEARSARDARSASDARQALKRRFALFVVASALVWLGVMLVGGDSGLLALWRARAKLDALEQRVRALEAENASLRDAIQSLETDEREVQRIAREELMMARPDEEVILVPDPKAPRDAPAPDATPEPGGTYPTGEKGGPP